MVTRWSHTNASRIFWSVVKSHDDFMTKPAVWHRWLHAANGFTNKCTGRSFAPVVAGNTIPTLYQSLNSGSQQTYHGFEPKAIKPLHIDRKQATTSTPNCPNSKTY